MSWAKTLSVVGAHAEGEIGRVVTSGVPDLPGRSVLEKLGHLNGERDWLRRFALFEPRGCAQMTTNLLLPPSHPDADAAFIPMQADGSHAMSGSNAMCVTTVLLETGILKMTEPQTTVVLDTAAGLVEAVADCAGGKVVRVSLSFFPSYCEALDAVLEIEGLGTVCVDVAFGGVFYVMPRAGDFGLRIDPAHARDMVEIGNRIKAAAVEQIPVQHPEVAAFNAIEFAMFTEEIDAAARIFRNGTVMPPGRMDRSPCGTGTAARLAVMHARRLLGIGTEVTMRSTINSEFRASISEETRVGGTHAVRTRISGRAWLYGFHELGSDPSDPFAGGFTMADTWGTGIEHVIPPAG